MPTFKPEGNYIDYTSEEWGNGSKIEFILHDAPQEGEHPSDRLEMLVKDQSGKQQGWLMNIEDAACIIRGLSRLLDNALAMGIEVGPNEKDKV